MDSDILEKMIMGILAVIIGIALITQGLIPTAVEMISGLSGQEAEWNSLLYLSIIMTVLSLVAVPLLILIKNRRS